jgi:Cu(I)/Ag(I) efflux system membrane fusion protein
MIKHLTYFTFLLLLAIGCENKSSDKTANTMSKMEGMSMKEMKHDTTTIDSALYEVADPTNKVVISDQETIKPTMKEAGTSISADGYIAFDERRNNKVSARFGGRIENLYVKYNYKYVKRGEKIMELYSPEVNTIEEEYLHHLKNISDQNLIQKTKEKLLLLGLSDIEINAIEKAGKPIETISIYSSYEGYIIFNTGKPQMKPEIKTSSQTNDMGMGGNAENNGSSSNELSGQIKEGSYVSKGQALFMVNDFKEVWTIAGFDSKSESRVRLNMPVKIKSELIDTAISAAINFIEPLYNEGQKFTQARIYIKNENGQYKINSLVTVEFSPDQKLMSLPNSAILDLGKRKIVWIKKGTTKEGRKIFEARTVTTENEMNGYTPIISGITDKNEVAKDAGYLIDNGSLIQAE